MKRIIFLVCALGLLACPAMATPTLTLEPPNGVIIGEPGASIGWGFSITNTADFLVPTSFQFLPSSALGAFTDFTGPPFYNFFVVGPGIYADGTTATQPFDETTGTGVGSFTIANTALPGQSANGNIELTYDLFSVSPNDPSFDPDVDLIATDQIVTAPAAIDVVPEPASLLLLGSGLALLGAFCVRRRRGHGGTHYLGMNTTNNELITVGIIILIMALFLLGGTTARAQTPLNETITVSSGDNGYIDNSFLGFHYEKQIMQGTMFRASNTNLINVYNKLLGNKGTLRMGGNTNDTTYWCGIGPPGNGTLSNCITSGDADEFAAFVNAIGWRVIYDVNEKSTPVTTYLPLSVAEAQYAIGALGSNLWGFEYGNEPTNNSTYFTNWTNFYNTLGQTATYIGPAGANFTLNAPFAMADGSKVILLTSHYYISSGTASGVTVDSMLASLDTGSTTLATLQNNCAAAVNLAETYVGGTHQWRNAEANNYSGGGASGISDTFASSLWVLEYLFTIAECGGQGVDIVNDVYNNNTFGYVPIYCGTGSAATDTNILVDNGPDVMEIRPEFYGLVLWERIANGTIENATQSGPAGNGFHSYAINENDGSYAVVLANNSETDTIKTTINLPRQYAGASYMSLTAPALDSTTDVTLGGSAIGVDGSWARQMQLLPMTNSGQTVTVTVNPASAVWVNLTNNTVLTGGIASKSGEQDARLWNISVNNNGTETATSSQIDNFVLNQTYGVPCTPVIDTAGPVSMSDIAAGGSASAGIMIDFTGCPATARFSLDALFSANGGSTTGVLVLNNQFR